MSAPASTAMGGDPLGVLGGDGDGAGGAAVLDAGNAGGDGLVVDGRGVDFLEEGGDLVVGGVGDLLEDGVGVFVAAVNALDVEHAEAAKFVHFDGHRGVDDAVHGGGDEGDGEGVLAEGEGGVGELGVDCHLPRDDCHFFKSVGPSQFLDPGKVHSASDFG